MSTRYRCSGLCGALAYLCEQRADPLAGWDEGRGGGDVEDLGAVGGGEGGGDCRVQEGAFGEDGGCGEGRAFGGGWRVVVVVAVARAGCGCACCFCVWVWVCGF